MTEDDTSSSGRAGRAAVAPAARLRRLERVVAWLVALLAAAAIAAATIGPRLGGDEPGLPGMPGFLCETVVAAWTQGGVMAAAAAALAFLRRLRPQAALLATAALLILGPQAWAAATAPRGRSADASAMRIASVNLCEDNFEHAPTVAWLRQLDADVLVLVEFTPRWARALAEAFPADYPHRALAAAPPRPGLVLDGLRVAVWSRLPPDGQPSELNLDDVNAQIRVPLRFAGRTFALYAIHPGKPYPASLYRRARRDRVQLLEWIAREDLPAVVAGDFNATPGSAFLLRLERLGYHGVAGAACGRSPVTWPMHRASLVPFRVAIDHVLCSDHFHAVGFARGPANGSDHAPVVAELAWRE